MVSQNDFWEKRYSEEEYAYGEEPNHFFQTQLQKLAPGYLLLPAEGEGRNAVYAAKQGWKVTAFDQAVAGKQKALRLAQTHGVNIEYKISSATEYTSTETFDAIALIYAHFDAKERAQVHQRLMGLLKRGGKVIFEAFSKEQIKNNIGGPRDEKMLFSEEEIRNEFSGLRFDFIDQEEVELTEGKYHQGKSSVLRFVGIKG